MITRPAVKELAEVVFAPAHVLVRLADRVLDMRCRRTLFIRSWPAGEKVTRVAHDLAGHASAELFVSINDEVSQLGP